MLCFAYLASFQKKYIDWPQQPPTEKMLKFNMIYHGSTQKNFFSKHKHKTEFECLDYSEVLFFLPETTFWPKNSFVKFEVSFFARNVLFFQMNLTVGI